MDPNESVRSHSHWVNGGITVTEHNTDLSRTWYNLWLGSKGQSKYTAETSIEGVELPYTMMESCSYLGPLSVTN